MMVIISGCRLKTAHGRAAPGSAHIGLRQYDTEVIIAGFSRENTTS